MDRKALADLIASRAVRQFAFHPPDAPGICFRGAEVRRGDRTASATGLGETDDQALAALAGEVAELAAEPATRPMTQADITFWPRRTHNFLGELNRFFPGVLACIPAEDPASGDTRPIPTPSRSMRDHDARMIFSPGVAAGPSKEFAVERAVLELVERDAVARWWLGGAQAAAAAFTQEGQSRFRQFKDRVRGGAQGRTEHLLDITSDLGVPCYASYSLNEEGRGFACGFAARLNPTEALTAAFREMCQMEAGLRLVALKRAQSGDDALSEQDRAQETRAATLTPDSCLALKPTRDADPLDFTPADSEASALSILFRAGIDIALADITPPDCPLKVIRAFAPGLQPLTEAIETDRFQRLKKELPGFTPASRLL